MKRSGLITMILSLLPLMGGPVQGQSVVIKSTATVYDSHVRLADLAELTDFPGTTAETLSQLEITNMESGKTEIKSEQIMGMLLSQDLPREILLKIQIRGAATCQVTREKAPVVPAIKETKAAPTNTAGVMANNAVISNQSLAVQNEATPANTTAITPANTAPKAPAASAEPTTLTETLQAEILRQLQVSPDKVRISFETNSPLMNQKLNAEQRWQTRSLNKWVLGSRQWDVQLLTNNKSTALLHVQGQVMMKVQGLMASMDISRGTLVNKDMFTVEERWVDRRSKEQEIQPSDVLGLEAIRAVTAGNPIDIRDFKQADLVVKGQSVVVYMVRGSLRIKVMAKAIDNGKMHDQIGLRCVTMVANDKDKNKPVEQLGERFEGMIIGPGLTAVGNLTPELEAQLREQK